MAETGCSAAGLGDFWEQYRNVVVLQQYEDAADLREFLIDAAIACDFETVASLAWTDVPENLYGWGTFWGASEMTEAHLRQYDATQNALWDLAVALIYTVPAFEFIECEGGGTAWDCNLSWYEWPFVNRDTPSHLSSHELERLALLDGTTPQVLADRLHDGYSMFQVVLTTDGRWMAAFPPSPGDCEAAPGSAIDRAGEPDSRRFFPWTDTLGCLVRVDVLFEYIGSAHCDQDDTRVLITGDPVGTRFGSTATPLTFVRDPTGTHVSEFLPYGFAELEELPADAVDSGFRLRDRELWTSPSDADAVFIRDSQGVERWQLGHFPPCL